MGFDSRQLTPGLVKKITIAGVKDRSEVEAAKTLHEIGGVKISAKTVNRILHDVGAEYIPLRDCSPSRLSKRLVPPAPTNAPAAVSVSCDGGRILTREAGHGPGVHGESWRETKNADFARLSVQTFDADPHPQLPECFCNAEHVAQLAESATLETGDSETEDGDLNDPDLEQADLEQADLEQADLEQPDLEQAKLEQVACEAQAECPTLNTANAAAHNADNVPTDELSCDSPIEAAEPDKPVKDADDWKPKRLHRTCLSSIVTAAEFGLHMKREALRRRFFEASTKAFLADGLPWNWSIWRKQFPDFVPILDFVHAVQYLFKAAKAEGATQAEAWQTYLHWAPLCWQGKVAEVIADMAARLTAHGIDPSSKVNKDSPYAALHVAHRYLTNNQSRMDYARYRCEGMPVTSAPMESVVKQIHLRVKGTEMFWNDDESSEGILQLRSAYLCDDNRLSHYLDRRPGHPYVRRTTLTSLQAP